jgi:hypothetical protein
MPVSRHNSKPHDSTVEPVEGDAVPETIPDMPGGGESPVDQPNEQPKEPPTGQPVEQQDVLLPEATDGAPVEGAKAINPDYRNTDGQVNDYGYATQSALAYPYSPPRSFHEEQQAAGMVLVTAKGGIKHKDTGIVTEVSAELYMSEDQVREMLSLPPKPVPVLPELMPDEPANTDDLSETPPPVEG